MNAGFHQVINQNQIKERYLAMGEVEGSLFSKALRQFQLQVASFPSVHLPILDQTLGGSTSKRGYPANNYLKLAIVQLNTSL